MTGKKVRLKKQKKTKINKRAEFKEEKLQICPECGSIMPGIKGSKSVVCKNCGYKDSCCY